MCGIAGYFDSLNEPEKVKQAVSLMVARMKHRGPDTEGLAIANITPKVILGHARLSIIDLSHDGNQPMTDPVSGNIIVFNGEIYNFRFLRGELESLGHSFRSQSDTEVLLRAYAEWGENCCKKLRGIFAFGIWDKRKQALFIARDQMGVKPLYYHISEGRLIFASEVRAILASGSVKASLDPYGLESYLAYGSVQEPLTLISGIRSLPPGCYTFFSGGSKLEINKYWDPFGNGTLSDKEEIKKTIGSRLREAVNLQLVSDVPLGVFLSGGIDSSSIVSLIRQEYSGRVRTFSIVFRDPRYDERKYARLVADLNGTEHTELELTSETITGNLKSALDCFDQPSMDGLNTWFVSKLVKESGITVALSGVGGDELFAGYNGFKKAMFMQRLQPCLSHLPVSLGRTIQGNSRKEQVRRIADMIGFRYPGYLMSRKLFSELQRSTLLDRSMLKEIEWHEACFSGIISDSERITDKISRISFFELKTYMLSTLLRDTDQMSMAHSLEVRVPLIDTELVELLLNLNGKYKMKRGIPKPLLVDAAGNGLPHECVYRKKQGFTFPFDQYYRESLGKEILDFFNESASLIFEKKELNSIWMNYLEGRVSWSRVWALFVLGWWLKQNSVQS